MGSKYISQMHFVRKLLLGHAQPQTDCTHTQRADRFLYRATKLIGNDESNPL